MRLTIILLAAVYYGSGSTYTVYNYYGIANLNVGHDSRSH